jgi:hypothetical protein
MECIGSDLPPALLIFFSFKNLTEKRQRRRSSYQEAVLKADVRLLSGVLYYERIGA